MFPLSSPISLYYFLTLIKNLCCTSLPTFIIQFVISHFLASPTLFSCPSFSITFFQMFPLFSPISLYHFLTLIKNLCCTSLPTFIIQFVISHFLASPTLFSSLFLPITFNPSFRSSTLSLVPLPLPHYFPS